MKKLLIGILVLVLGVALLAPFGLGYVADKRFIALLDKMAESGMIDYTVLRTDRGWFSTDMEVVMEISGDMADGYNDYRKSAGKPVAANPGVLLKSRLYHGPVAIASFSEMGTSFSPVVSRVKTDVYVDQGDGTDGELLPVNINTLFKLAGGGVTSLSMDSWKGDLEGGDAQIQWDGVNGQFVFSEGFATQTLDLTAPLLSIKGSDGVFSVKDMSIKSDTYTGIQEIELGTASLSVGKMIVQNPKDKQRISIDGLSFAAESTASGELVNSVLSMKMGVMNVAGLKFGPGVLSLELNNLDAASVAKISKQVKEMRGSNMPEEQLSMMVGSTMLSILPDLLKQGPELLIKDISLDSPYGKLSMTGSIRVDSTNEMAMANPLLLAEAVIADLKLSIPEDLLVTVYKLEVKKELEAESLEHTPEMLEEMARNRVTMQMSPLVAQGMLVYAEGKYIMSMSFEAGRLEVNGQEIPIAALMSGMQGGGQ
ncbi:MAG TPA: DUF945 domain-containing protein [Gammaproteobacteria bacterium]|nr:DUF945 domain-containing protein [Gammaproteobacteria bacterium]